MVSLCRRNYAAHTRDEIFEALGDVIGDRWKVDLKNPDHVILMEAIKVGRRRSRRSIVVEASLCKHVFLILTSL